MSRNSIQEHLDKCFTPDLPVLRYKKPRLVFLWDPWSQYNNWSRLPRKIKPLHDIKTKRMCVYTVNNFLPFRVSNTNHFLLPSDANWPKFIDKEEFDTNFDTTPRRVRGALVEVTLEGLMSLDNLYKNGHLTYRRKLQVVENSFLSNEEPQIVWAYFASINSLRKWDPHTNKQSFKKGVVPLNTPAIDINRNKYYNSTGMYLVKEN